MNEIEVKGIKKVFNNKSVLDNISFSVKKGELMCLLGESGCGKSTTLNIIAGLLQQDQGEILISGKDVKNIPVEKREIVIVFQEYMLFPHLNVYKNIAFGLNMRKENKNIIKEKVRKIVEILSLKGLENKYPKELSGGQKQRVAIGRALAIEPKVLLLDEPFTSLDINIRNSIRELVLKIQKKLGITTILVTHDKEEALMMSDHIALMIDGKIMQYGTPKEIYENPNSKEVANFFGERNYFKGKIIKNKFHFDFGEISINSQKQGYLEIMINPENIKINRNLENKDYIGEIISSKYAGDRIYYVVKYNEKEIKIIDYSNSILEVGDKVALSIDFSKSVLF
ncbi:ABC transporter ATP-binding protein [Clostridium botulinum]|nr:ABC transporter ATP-binding protein [Clostridium botulinum]